MLKWPTLCLLLPLGCAGLPMVGEIKNRFVVHGAEVDHPVFGESTSVPTVLEIKVDERSSSPGDVGRKVKRAFFQDEGPLVFNVAFSCGDPSRCGGGRYADPKSIWFNVFFGYYQIDVPREVWKRPFAYRLEAGGGAAIEPLDIVKIGKADWNYFSNYMYGVPEAAIEPYNRIDPAAVQVTPLPRVKIGDTYWDQVALDGVEVVSAYVSEQDDGELVQADPLWTPVWRSIFGPSEPSLEFPTSFIPTKMRARLYLSYRERYDKDLKAPAYSTLIFGATVNAGYPDAEANEEFLQAQLTAIRRVMLKSYAKSGFPSPG